jgi:hypothetical protein
MDCCKQHGGLISTSRFLVSGHKADVPYHTKAEWMLLACLPAWGCKSIMTKQAASINKAVIDLGAVQA